ncbi:MAG: hypothetical protein RBG13Loki_3975 [Promethearchaeota archaeon CR_4]|nr:MAG: hypothetical protein RBG13Loki_3975 [Candidatus Lokiarchaeota archaeon CR_4]
MVFASLLMNRNRVALVKQMEGESIQLVVWRALDLIEASSYLSQFSTFLLKPNYIVDKDPRGGLTTHPESLDGVISYLFEKVGKSPNQVIIGEGGYASTTDSAFEICGARNLARKHGVKLVNLNEDEKDRITLRESLALKEVNIAHTARMVDCVISVPSLKTHSMAVTTLAMKNCMGCILPKGIMHGSLHQKIADLAALINPKLSVIDGIIGGEGSEEYGDPVPMGIIIAGIDYVAVDTVGSAVMGYNPTECKYLQYGAKKGLGICDLKDIDVVGVSIDSVRRKFHR